VTDGAEAPASADPPLLAVEDLVVRYGAAVALNRVSLRVHAGERVALIGPNGAGKSTLLNTVCGHLRPAEGDIALEGRSVAGLSPTRVVQLGVIQVPEGRQVFPSLSVRSNLLLGALGGVVGGQLVAGSLRYLSMRRELRARLDEVHELLPRLAELGERPAGDTSGGEQQMVAIGRALMARPRLLAIDEMSLGLAPLIVQDIARFLRELNEQRGVTILLIEQNVRLALDLCDRVYVLDAGANGPSGASADLRGDPALRSAYLGGGVQQVAAA
jgi:branched-chain amino acid transport system ATP-binding protein